MDFLPKCKICGERHRLGGGCGSVGRLAALATAKRAVAAIETPSVTVSRPRRDAVTKTAPKRDTVTDKCDTVTRPVDAEACAHCGGAGWVVPSLVTLRKRVSRARRKAKPGTPGHDT